MYDVLVNFVFNRLNHTFPVSMVQKKHINTVFITLACFAAGSYSNILEENSVLLRKVELLYHPENYLAYIYI